MINKVVYVDKGKMDGERYIKKEAIK